MSAETQTRKFAVVTGASSGIGLELAKQFAENGFDLLIAAEDQNIQRAAEELKGLGSDVTPLRVDLASSNGVEQLFEGIENSRKHLDAIAINAGVGVSGRFVETDLSAELNLVQLNVVSTLHLAKLAAKKMVAQGSGRILFTASIASEMPTPYETVYGASKAFVLSLSQGLREELKETGVSVTALMPGPTETNFFHRAGADDTKLGTSKKDEAMQVAKEGFEAMMAAKDHVVAGSFMNKVQVAAAHVLPDPMVAKTHAAAAKPGSAR